MAKLFRLVKEKAKGVDKYVVLLHVGTACGKLASLESVKFLTVIC
jgi:hypothetical protein